MLWLIIIFRRSWAFRIFHHKARHAKERRRHQKTNKLQFAISAAKGNYLFSFHATIRSLCLRFVSIFEV